LVAALLPDDKIGSMFIYIFLFLLGFNLVMWSVGVYMLRVGKTKEFFQEDIMRQKGQNKLGSLFSPPVIAVIFSLVFIFFNLNKFFPQVLFKPLRMVGDCTLPLAMFIVGGNLAEIHLSNINKKAIILIVLAKLIILPLFGLLFITRFNFSELIGLLILLELSMPPATSLSLIIRHYKKQDLLISQGIFFGHIASIITIPLFLSLYHIFAI
jgi:predicted permease